MNTNNYNYGNSIISTDLRLDFNINPYYQKEIDLYQVELRVYCGEKLMATENGNYENCSIEYGIRKTFKEKIENRFTFYKGKRYYISFKIFKLKDITRYEYKKTNTLLHIKRRKYLLRERINVVAS